MSKLSYLVLLIQRIMIMIVLGGFTPMSSLLFFLNRIICVSVPLSRLLKGYFTITMSPSINGIATLVRMNEHTIRTSSSYCELFRPSSYNRKRVMFHLSTVVVWKFIRHRFLSGIFTKRNGVCGRLLRQDLSM